MKKQAILKEVKIKHIPDEYGEADLSYLDQFENSTDPEEQKCYEQDQERKRNYGITWESMGIKAEAIIYIPFEVVTGKGKETNYKLQTIDSCGLWGIETDSENSYIEEVGKEQIEELKDYLKILNVNMKDFNWDNLTSSYQFFKKTA